MAEWYRSEYVKCGKAGCRRCPHGPYWYAYWRQDGKLRKRYIGKVDPRKGEEQNPHDDIFDARKATLRLAFDIMGLPYGSTLERAKQTFRELSKKLHPDRGGTDREQSRLNAAWSYVRSTLSP